MEARGTIVFFDELMIGYVLIVAISGICEVVGWYFMVAPLLRFGGPGASLIRESNIDFAAIRDADRFDVGNVRFRLLPDRHCLFTYSRTPGYYRGKKAFRFKGRIFWGNGDMRVRGRMYFTPLLILPYALWFAWIGSTVFSGDSRPPMVLALMSIAVVITPFIQFAYEYRNMKRELVTVLVQFEECIANSDHTFRVKQE
jgi:hypothetical protein